MYCQAFSQNVFLWHYTNFFSNKGAIKRPSSYYESRPKTFMAFIKSDFVDFAHSPSVDS